MTKKKTQVKSRKAAYTRTRTSGLLRSEAASAVGGEDQRRNYTLQSPSAALSGTYKVTTDVVTPGFDRLVKAEMRVNNPFLSVTTTARPSITSTSRRWPLPGGSHTGWDDSSGAVTSWADGDLSQKTSLLNINSDALNRAASIDAWKKVSAPSSLSWVTLAELDKSLETIATRAKKLALVVQACRRRDITALGDLLDGKRTLKKPKRFLVWDDDGKPLLTKRGKTKSFRSERVITYHPRYLDDAARLWLEYRNGWTPMVYDIVNTLKAIYAADLRNSLIKRDILVARGKAEDTKVITRERTTPFNGLSYNFVVTESLTYSVNTYIHYSYQAPDGMMRRLNDFGLFDVPSSIWELVPFSYIADWFIPIGDWLTALTPRVDVNILDSGHTMKTIIDFKRTLTGPSTQTVGGITYTLAAPVGSKDSYQQTVLQRKPTLGIPGFPPIDIKLNVKKLADAVALFRSLR